ncbi:caspase domain-containing protein [Mycena pura]|uniref:Caspase domain-containing protein n=1 Tax=Mycena pura TaxID=153505 RepID=A0AAD7E1B0_9AGAR|nr:caspase domain-containing protein [Mycena pura]
MSVRRHSFYFLFLIAIDKYQANGFYSLHGCVNDAKRVKSCLADILGPPSSVFSLYDEQATRVKILSSFQSHLIDNPDIKPGDAIIIYYAGHGNVAPAPGPGAPGDTVETMCPVDESTDPKADFLVPSIPDVTINALLRTLAREKGNNIIFICDCCHSGGLDRSVDDHDGVRARTVSRPSLPIHFDIDRNILNAAGGDTRFGFHGDNTSHIFLAACGPHQKAYEDKHPCGGRFTSALIRALRELRERLSETTYVTLFKTLQLAGPPHNNQSPQFHGLFLNRILFTRQIQPALWKNAQLGHNGELRVDAGAIHGLVRGTEMTTFGGSPGPMLVCHRVEPFYSVLRRKESETKEVPRHAFAVGVHRWNAGSLVVRLASALADVDITADYQLIGNCATPYAPYIAVDWNPYDRSIVIKWLNGDRLIDCLVPDYSSPSAFKFTDVRWRLEAPADVPSILAKIAHFHHHLVRSTHAAHPLDKLVVNRHAGLRMYRLQYGALPESEEPKDVLGTPDGVAVLDDGGHFGFEIYNKTKRALYPYLFCFAPATCSIHAVYMPPLGAFLAPNGSVTIGYGPNASGGVYYFEPDEPGCDDIYFLKLFVSTRYVDMHHIQSDPHATPHADSHHDLSHDRGFGRTQPQREDHWDVTLAAVIRRCST